MTDNFEYISHARLIYRDGYRNAYLGEIEDLSSMVFREHYASTMAPKKDLQSLQPSII